MNFRNCPFFGKLTGTHIKPPFKTSKQLFSGKKGQISLKNGQKYTQITIEIALYKSYFAENGLTSKDDNFGTVGFLFQRAFKSNKKNHMSKIMSVAL